MMLLIRNNCRCSLLILLCTILLLCQAEEAQQQRKHPKQQQAQKEQQEHHHHDDDHHRHQRHETTKKAKKIRKRLLQKRGGGGGGGGGGATAAAADLNARKGGGGNFDDDINFADDGLGGLLFDDDEYQYYDDDYDLDVKGTLTITLKITNLSYQQPFAPMFVMVHNADAIPLFTLGRTASVALQILAENGDPTPLAEAYSSAEGVFFSGIYTEGSPWNGGSDIFITLPYRPLFPYLTIAAMTMNTNDCFVALNGVRIVPNLVVTGPGYDAGSERNDEQCASVPGPACEDDDNVRSGNGEGFVHVHRGISGIGDLEPETYDWRNPMIRVEMMNPFA